MSKNLFWMGLLVALGACGSTGGGFGNFKGGDLAQPKDGGVVNPPGPDMAQMQQGPFDMATNENVVDLADPGCADPEIMCNGSCTDVTSDPSNCGACNKACANNSDCVNSKCVAMMAMTGCNGCVGCLNGCAGAAMCQMACVANTTKNGQTLLQAVLTCLQAACPSKAQGDICFTQSMACSTCLSTAQAMGGKCFTMITACDNDKP